MIGEVFFIPIQGRTQTKPHPHVVVAEPQPDDFLLVPAFSEEGPEVKKLFDALYQMGYSPDHIYVGLDNADRVDFVNGWTGKEARWVIARAHRLPRKVILRNRRIGTMDSTGLRRICAELLALSKARPQEFPATVRNAIKTTLDGVV